jgi:CDP-glycerol glycerophosphotransferase (TagB/SpsB family)
LKIIDLNKFNKEKINFLEKNYIFFPLHFQPERSTLPEGLLFSDQLKAIKILSNVLPKNWKIVVKEHPRQLIIDYRNFHYRSKKFYIDLQKIKNVIYMSSKSNYFELLKHCRVTATISGSVTFDGLLVNKPGITFASTWLDDHCYINLYKNLSDLKFFLININNNKFTKFDKELINFFLRNRGKFYNGCSFDGWWSVYSGKIRNIMIKNSVNALLKCINLQNK